jgi:siroheme synthase-like protein
MKKKANITAYYPVSLNIRGRKCVVVGGGEVALRKVKALLEHGAEVEVISPDLCPELARLGESGEISIHNHAHETGNLAGAFLVVAATDDAEINQQVAKEARSKTILVNVVDDAANSDFIVPSYLRREGLTIAVSTSGQSPALAGKIRARLEQEITEQHGALTRLIGETRAEIKQAGMKIEDNRWQEVLDLDLLLELLKKGKRKKAKDILLSRLKEGQGKV